MPSFSYAAPNARRTDRFSDAFAKRFCTSISTAFSCSQPSHTAPEVWQHLSTSRLCCQEHAYCSPARHSEMGRDVLALAASIFSSGPGWVVVFRLGRDLLVEPVEDPLAAYAGGAGLAV